jgi:lysozyme
MYPPMKTSANGRQFIEQWEGDALKAYQDTGGVWTIGDGHTSAAGLPNVYPGMIITPQQQDAILSADLASVEADVNHHVSVKLTQNQFDALVSFDFNTGALARSNVLKSINSGNFADVAADLKLWDHVGRNVVQGLLNRRIAEGKLFNTPDATLGG